ncbi:glycosyltransferase, partial [Shewanella sp. Isolate7]|uniref:glycosyltransferase n=1 Tax=Shewanella sp. Isolate7 TaxID=2908528 RepID=UPI001EFDF9E1|nr:hypothetical protein [Shewanella sp. Isolate7]
MLINSISNNLSEFNQCEITVLTGCDKLMDLDVTEISNHKNISINVIDISSELASFCPSGRFPAQVYARFFMGNYIKGTILYLDVDMIVNCCISDLFKDFDSESGFGACIDTGILFNKALGINKLSYDFTYFNAGMFICDLNNPIVLKYFRDAIVLAQKNNYPLADQDALNFSIQGRFNVMPVKFNYAGVFFSNRYSIIHYAHLKPTLQLRYLSAFKQYNQYVTQLHLSFPYRKYS